VRILVTGAAGFIGSSLAESLIAQGHAVCGLDNFDEFYDPAIKRRNVRGLLASDRFTLVEADIRNAEAVEEAFDRAHPEAVIHLAARAGVRPSLENAPLYVDVNLCGSTILFEASVRHRVGRFLFASSSSVYGERPARPFTEDDPVDTPVSPYAATKRAGEILAWTYAHLYRLPIHCLRFFTVYGPRQRPEMAIHAFARAIEEDRELVVYGDGSAQRDFTYISDIVSGIEASLARCEGYRIYNLGGAETVRVIDMIHTIEAALGKRARIRYEPAAPGDVPVTFADVTRARQELGYAPRVKLADGIGRFVAWYRAERDAARTTPAVESVDR
jgi:UDP-glucuronate 4-epimerase